MGPISDCFFRRHWNRPNYRIKSDKDLTVRRCAKISRLSSVSGFEHGEEARSRRGWRCAPHGCTSGGLKLSPIRVLSVCLLVPDRYNCLDGRASHHGIDFEPSADLMQALAHARQPDALRGAVLSTDQLTHAADDRHALARIVDCEPDTIPVLGALAHETDLRRRTVRMWGNVGHGFLHNTEQYQFRVGREPLHRRRDVELHRDTAALLEALDIMAERQGQPRFVE